MRNEMNDRTELVAHESTVPVSVGLTDLAGFELAQRSAKLLAASTIVPTEYQGNLPNCVVALNMAARMRADPLMIMQNLHLVHGRPGWSAQFLIATFNTCGRFSVIRYTFFGEEKTDGWGCRAWSIEKDTAEQITGADITIALAKSEGWYGRQGSKWRTMPQQMLMYRSAAWLVRAYAPELSMGLHTTDELGDVYDAEKAAGGEYAIPEHTRRTVADLKGEPEQAPRANEPVQFDEEDRKNIEREKLAIASMIVPQENPPEQGKDIWPQKILIDGELVWTDSEKKAFDEAEHGMSAGGVPAVTKNGVFRKRRGLKRNDPPPPIEQTEPIKEPTDGVNINVITDMLKISETHEEVDEIAEVVANMENQSGRYVLDLAIAKRRGEIESEAKSA